MSDVINAMKRVRGFLGAGHVSSATAPCLLLVGIVVAGCGQPRHCCCDGGDPKPRGFAPLTGSETSAGPVNAREMRALPVDAHARRLIDAALAAARGVRTARMEFQRRERLGLFRTLGPRERMTALCREEPFSVLFTWLDDDSEFSQCLYVEAAHDGAVQLHRRRGLFGGPGGVVKFAPDLAVTFGQAKLPITEFGPRRVMEALRRRIDAAEPFGGVRARYVGESVVGPMGEVCDHVVLQFPREDAHRAKLVDLHLHGRTYLPVMIELWLTDKAQRDADTPLDARYIFANVEINPALTDDDFRLDVDRGDGA